MSYKGWCLFLLMQMIHLSNKTVSYITITHNWRVMQEEYKKLCEITDNTQWEEDLCHPHWKKARQSIKQLLTGPVQMNILNDKTISHNMIRRGFKNSQKYEMVYLKHCVSPETRAILLKYQDTSFGDLPPISQEFPYSVSTLGHLFYAGKISEMTQKEELNTIVEFGGGYGNLARILRYCYPKATIILIDLPEFIAIQAFFLRLTTDSEPQVHTTLPINIVPGAINLIPVAFMDNLSINADLFISTFALSEASAKAQQTLVDRDFYHATTCYLVGQLEGWQDLTFVDHSTLLQGVRSLYPKVICQPFHEILEEFPSYELIGTCI